MRSEFSHHASVSYWISKSDRMNREFFVAHRQRPAGSTMRAIRDFDEVLHTDPDEVLDIASAFYEDLFTADPVTVEIVDAREQIWSVTHSGVTVYSDLEVAFVISENKEVLDLMGKMGELLIGGTAISSQFYYGCLFQELLAFQLPGRHSKPKRIPTKEAEAHFIKVLPKTLECLGLADTSFKEQGSEEASMSSVENLLTTPISVKMAIFESFARQNISEMETNPTTEILRFVKLKVGIPTEFSPKIVLSDSSKALFSKLAVGCRDVGGTLFFPAGCNEAYIYAAKLLGMDVRIIETRPETSFKVTESIVGEAFAASEKPYLYITGPTIYPTGTVYFTSEIKSLISACSQHGAHMIVDTSFSGQEFNSSGAWDLQDVNCSNVTLFGNFSSTLLVGGLEFAYALVQDSFSSSLFDSWNISKPHGTLRYTMQKLLRLYNDNDDMLLEELNEQQKQLLQKAE
ncbi:hypothetical protein L7F22_031869 [Adiantum nelumboides]|nr:hypothetical protein [Adiantum nelumboides]